MRQSPVFTGTALELATTAGIRAVQSTPLVSSSGRRVGMCSTHYRTPRRPTDQELCFLDLLARQAADLLEHVESTSAFREIEAERRAGDMRRRAAIEATTDALFISDAGGRVVSGRDVTARKALAEALHASEARYRGLAEQVPVGIFIADADGRLLDANQAGCDLVGYPLAELRTLGLTDLLAANETAQAAQQRLDAAAGGALRTEWQFRRKDGSTFLGELLGRRLPDGRLQGVVRDISGLKSAERAIRALEAEHRADSETLRALLATTAQAILEVDEAGLIRSANPALESMLGWAPGELVGQPHALVIPAASREAHARHQSAYWAAPRARPMAAAGELAALRKDGSTIPVEVSLAPVTTTHGRVVFAFVSDISARRREEAARQAYARELEHRSDQLRELTTELTLAEQRAREELSRTLHDGLQQSLFSVKLTLDHADQRLREGIPVAPATLARVRHDLQAAITEARTLAVELAPPALHDGGLPQAIAWLAGWMEQKHGLHVEVSADAGANPDSADVRTLAFLSVRELLFNVAKHAGVSHVEVELRAAGGHAQITIDDRGVGFDPAVVLHSGRPSAGIGLRGIRERLTRIGGSLDIQSAPGRGTHLSLRVPLGVTAVKASSAAETPGADAAAPRAADGPLRIVIADDHAFVREGLRALIAHRPELQLVGEAHDGPGAIAQVSALRPDVVIMDVSMPGMSGVEATRRIRSALPEVEILALSTQARPTGGHPVEAAGAAGYFCKGDDTQALIARLLAMHETRRAQAPATDRPM